MKEFLEYVKSKGVKEIDVDILCLLSDFFKETESKQFTITDVGSSSFSKKDFKEYLQKFGKEDGLYWLDHEFGYTKKQMKKDYKKGIRY